MKRFALATFFVLIEGCGQDYEPPNFVSPCGVRVYGSDDLHGFTFVEARSIAAFRTVEPQLCQHLHNWTVSVGYSDLGGRPEQTWVDLMGIQLVDDSWRAIPHAFGHVSQYPDIDYEHATWPSNGIQAAVDEAQ